MTDPAAQVDIAFHMGARAAAVGRGRAAVGERRVGHHDVEGTGRALREIAGDYARRCGKAIERHAGLRIFGKQRLTLEPGEIQSGHARGETEQGRAGSAAGVEDLLTRLRGNGGGEQHGIDRDAIAAGGLADVHTAAQQAVVGKAVVGRFHRRAG